MSGERTTQTNTHLALLRTDHDLFYLVPLLEHSTMAVPVNTVHVQYPGTTLGHAQCDILLFLFKAAACLPVLSSISCNIE